MGRSRWKKKHGKLTLRSGLEKRTAEYLETNKIPFEYETMTIEYTVPSKVHKYKPDFILESGIIVEAKGRFDAATRQKMAHVIEQNPDLDIRLLFQRDNTISKSSKTTYTAWCEKRGIKCHVSASGELPDDWLKPPKRRKKKDA